MPRAGLQRLTGSISCLAGILPPGATLQSPPAASERPQPSKAPRPPNMQGRFFAVCFKSLFCNADDGEGRTFCFDEGLPASTTGACDALKDSLPEAVRRLPAHTAGRYRVSRMSLGRWATAISSLPLSLSGVHPIGWTQVRPSGGAASRSTGRLLDIVELSYLIRSPRRRGRAVVGES